MNQQDRTNHRLAILTVIPFREARRGETVVISEIRIEPGPKPVPIWEPEPFEFPEHIRKPDEHKKFEETFDQRFDPKDQPEGTNDNEDVAVDDIPEGDPDGNSLPDTRHRLRKDAP